MNALIEAAEEYIEAAETYRCSVDPSVEREITMIIARERLREEIKLVREVAAPARAHQEEKMNEPHVEPCDVCEMGLGTHPWTSKQGKPLNVICNACLDNCNACLDNEVRYDPRGIRDLHPAAAPDAGEPQESAELDAASEALREHGGTVIKSGLAASIAMTLRSMNATRDALLARAEKAEADLAALDKDYGVLMCERDSLEQQLTAPAAHQERTEPTLRERLKAYVDFLEKVDTERPRSAILIDLQMELQQAAPARAACQQDDEQHDPSKLPRYRLWLEGATGFVQMTRDDDNGTWVHTADLEPARAAEQEHDGGVAETERRHSAHCREQEAIRQREADALQAGFETGRAARAAEWQPLTNHLSFAAEVIEAFLKMGVCPHGYDRDDLHAFAVLLEGIVRDGLPPCALTGNSKSEK